MKYALIVLLSLFCSFSYCGTIDPNKPDTKYIEYGSKFNYVFRIKCITNSGIIYFASATAIDNHWLLTAAHVVSKSTKVEIMIGDRAVRANKVIVHKDFIEENYGFYDIAMCHIEESLNLNFYPELYQMKDEVGKICSISGFGSYGTFATGVTGSDGRRRAGSNIVENIDRHLLVCKPSKSTAKDNTELEFIIANGDSGGGLFIGNKLAGINSCVTAIDRKTDSSYGDEAGHTRVSQFIDWIESSKNK